MKFFRPWQVGVAVSLMLAPAVGAGLARAAEDPTVLFPDCPTTDNIKAAKIAHLAALDLFERKEWDRAIENWRLAYKLDCKAHGVLINAAAAYEAKGDLESAVAMLESYLRRNPNATDASTVIKKIDELKTAQPPKVTPSAAPSASVSAAPAASSAPVRPPPPPLGKPQRPHGMAPWALVGAGSAAAVVGAILVPVGLRAISAAEEACPDRACRVSQDDVARDGNAGRSKVIGGDVLLGVGLAAMAGGLVWQFAFNKPRLVKVQGDDAPPAPSVSVAPIAAPTLGGAAITGRF